MRTFEDRVRHAVRYRRPLRRALEDLQVLHLDHPRALEFERDVLKVPDVFLAEAAKVWAFAGK